MSKDAVRVSLATIAVVLCACMACAPHTPPPVAARTDAGQAEQARLQAADTLLRTGCLDCLRDAFDAYESVREASVASTPQALRAATGAVRAALLIDLRQRGLGISDEGYLQRARDLLSAHADLDPAFRTLIDIVDTTPWRFLRVGGASADLAGLRRLRTVQTNRDAWLALLQRTADEDLLSASLWVAFSCANSPPAARQPAILTAALPSLHDMPSVQYELAVCGPVDDANLTALLQREPRFTEAEFWIGMDALGQRRLDDAQAHLSTAFDWHPRWPSAALTLADISMMAEDLAEALRLYDATLTLAPDLPTAILGRVRALSYLDRYTDALSAVDDLARVGWYPAEGAYWRAWNELQLDRLEDAWTHVQDAERLSTGADVSKLAGLVALKRGALVVARGRFEMARTLNPMDCESLVYLGAVHADLRDWALSADAFAAAATCLQDTKNALERQIAALAASDGPPERVARQLASRQQQLARADRMLVQSWFNTAVDDFNLSRTAEARAWAEKVVDDPQVGARARDLLARLAK